MSTQVITDERDNKLSASFMPIAANCAGAKNLIDAVMKSGQMPKETADSVRDSGIDIHAAMETEDYTALPEAEKDIAARLKNLEEKAKDSWLQEYWSDSAPVVMREQRLWIRDRETLEPLVSAKVDVAFVMGVSGLELDYKSGYLEPTPAELNWQLKTQAVALWHEHTDLIRVRTGIAASRMKDILSLADYTLRTLKDAEWEILNVVKKTKEPDAPRFPGTHCRYCPVRIHCREHVSWLSMEIVPFDGSKDDLDVILKIHSLAPAEVAKIYSKAKLIKLILDAAKQRLLSLQEDELSALGLAKKDGANVRKVVDSAKVLDVLTGGDSPMISKDNLLKILTPGVGQIDSIVMAATGVQKKSVQEKVVELFGDAIETKQNAPSVVPNK